MVAASYYYPTASGPTRNQHNHGHLQHAPSGRKHAAPFYQSTNQSSYLHTAQAVPSPFVKRVHSPAVARARPVFEPTLPKDQTDLRVRLHHRLKDGSLLAHIPGGFPFRHTLSDSKGKSKLRATYEPYDIKVSNEDFGPNESIGIVFKGPGPSLKYAETATISSRSPPSRYFTWQAYASVREARWNGQGYMYAKSSHKTVLAQVRVDPAVMYTSYGKFVRTDSRVLSRALAISLELGVLITIVSTDETANSYSGSNLLLRSVLSQKRDVVATEHSQYWSKWLAGYDYEYGYFPQMTADSILYIGTSNHGYVDLLYTYPNSG
ncbi:hypothetical protein J3R30DRAFT_3718135 [Lentinula aciculospora]|uniref:Uncharacterized protein n=1 Tax=Lentinula aciculospora TaxID=153920 RepID=A0A9W8ZUM2_9AGAR|nr:hypothetical protein J3R30DRAFT_3718135 [Lentinula aciculospora]